MLRIARELALASLGAEAINGSVGEALEQRLLEVQRHAADGVAIGEALRRWRGRPVRFQRVEEFKLVQHESWDQELLFYALTSGPAKISRARSITQQADIDLRVSYTDEARKHVNARSAPTRSVIRV